MIPLRLKIKNFMCYRGEAPALDLEGIHVACLCGDNGHGKTALLDAITWALWGQTRARTQEELVHQGQQDMLVELDFIARAQRYRVNRRHSRGARNRQGTTILELQMNAGDMPQAITGNSIKDTEKLIQEILNMDYDTFINTSYLRQGDTDRFTTSTPSTRKEILGEVLDLSYYSDLETKAKSKSRSLGHDLIGIDKEMSWRQQEITRKPNLCEQLISLESALSQLSIKIEGCFQNIRSLQRNVHVLQERQQIFENQTKQLTASKNDILHLEQQIQGHKTRVVDFETTIQRETEIRDQFYKLQTSNKEFERLNDALESKNSLDKDKSSLEKELAIHEERLSSQAKQLIKRISSDLTPRVERMANLQESLRLTTDSQTQLEISDSSLQQDIKYHQEIISQINLLQEHNDSLKNNMEETRNKFDLLERGDSVCPLCEQALGAGAKAHLKQEYESQGLDDKKAYEENISVIKKLDQESNKMSSNINDLQVQLKKRRQQNETKAANLERDILESKKASEELKDATLELKSLEKSIKDKGFAKEERQALAKIDASISQLLYDTKTHQEMKESVRTLKDYAVLHSKLLEAIENLPIEQEGLKQTQGMLQRQEGELTAFHDRQKVLSEELSVLPSLERQLSEETTFHQSLTSQRDGTLGKKAVITQEIARCSELEIEMKQLTLTQRKLLDEVRIYDELGLAFGKNGIQSLIMAASIPQLNNDANELLARLTENQMSLNLQIVKGRKDRRTGLSIEELDIKISDGPSTRSYETFSGGEAFRVNFALRIALSKLLARRSGAPLPILFIDEGFGSQDVSGQERLTEAIQSIQDDFDKIIVITHIEQIKEAFPVHISVTKREDGSSFQIE